MTITKQHWCYRLHIGDKSLEYHSENQLSKYLLLVFGLTERINVDMSRIEDYGIHSKWFGVILKLNLKQREDPSIVIEKNKEIRLWLSYDAKLIAKIFKVVDRGIKPREIEGLPE